MKKGGLQKGKPASQLVDERIRKLSDRRGAMLSRRRRVVKEADPNAVEE
ncbi:MAG TPA: hypothetical protein VFS39_03780 [Nitrospira sp.]|nr:hypothetical protein [Nitrospira sp.]